MLRVSFPHMGDYHLPISRLLEDILPQAEIFSAPPISQRTIDLGGRHSPDFICSPFKYNLGNYIEALEAGANVLLQTGMGCRYGYYGELQEQILRDMGYSFQFLCFSRDRARLRAVYCLCRRLNPDLQPMAFGQALLLAVERIMIMDKLDYILRERIGFEVQPGSFEQAKQGLLSEMMESNSIWSLRQTYKKYRDIYQKIQIDLPREVLRVGMIGELYTLMEPFANHYLEKQLAQEGIMVSRRMSVTFLLFGKHDRISLKKAAGYLQYTVGANGVDSVCQGRKYADKGYDGILHIKSFGCTPELNAQPALIKMGRERDIPILHLSFDSQTSQTGLQTRIEAFIDMIKMKRERIHETNSQPGSRCGLHFH